MAARAYEERDTERRTGMAENGDQASSRRLTRGDMQLVRGGRSNGHSGATEVPPDSREEPLPPQVDDEAEGRGKDTKPSGIKARLQATKERLMQYASFRVLASTAEGFIEDRVTENAAGMTYYGAFSIFPLVLLFMSILGLVLGSDDAARERVMAVVMTQLPEGQEAIGNAIEGVIDARGVAAGVGIVALVWGALGFFQIIDRNVNEIWGVTKPRSFIRGKLFALAMVGAIGGVALASFAATAAVNLMQRFTGEIPGAVWVWQIVVSLVSFLTIAAVFYALYRYAPRRDIKFEDVWPAALATALLWELTRRFLSLYLERADIVSGYGPIGAAMAMLFWLYISCIIILLGAEFSYAIAKERRHILVEDELEVVAPPGEQPTPKFAPQVGGGHYTSKDEDEPIKSASEAAAEDGKAAEGQPARARPAISPAHAKSGSGLGPGAGVAARPDAAGERRPIYLDVPLVAMIGVCIGFVLGWVQKDRAGGNA